MKCWSIQFDLFQIIFFISDAAERSERKPTRIKTRNSKSQQWTFLRDNDAKQELEKHE